MKKLCSAIVSVLTLSAIVNLAYATPPRNLSCAKNEVIQYFRSGAYERDVATSMVEVNSYFDKRILEKNIKQKKIAIVMDIDETVLSNFEGNLKRDFSGVSDAVQGTYKNADAPAIEPVLAFYNKALNNGVDVFFVTWRSERWRPHTILNLQRAGYFGWKEIYMPTKEEKNSGAANYKTKIRKALTDNGYQIMINLGDQDSDLEGGYADYTFKLPNPLYTTNQRNCEHRAICM